jgi:Rrf2 family protein
MRLSSKTEYAIKTLMDLCTHGANGPVCINDIATREHIPVKFLEQILLALKGAGLTQSKRGPKGGYNLAKQADQISIAEVVRLTEGSFANSLPKESIASCPLQELWSQVDNKISETLESCTINDLCARKRELIGNPSQHYSI